MNTKKPYFSIVMATYNRAHLLPRALDSVLSQNEKDWELIVIDDGSEDNTSALIQDYLENCENINYYFQENKGFIQAKNAGIEKAKGKFISFLDSDDAYEKDHLELRKQILEKHPEIDFLHGGVRIVGQPYVPDVNNPGEKIHLSECFIGGTYFMNKNAIEKLKGFGSTALETDFDMMSRAKKAGLHIVKTDFPTYVYYRDAGSSITNDMLDLLED